MLLFSEPPPLTGSNDATKKRLEQLSEKLHPTLLEGGELCATLGGSYLRVVWDEEISDRPWLSAVAGDSAVPEFAYGHLKAVTFWAVVHVDGNTVWRHLERHERGRILHGLYVGTLGMLGRRMALQDRPETEAIAEHITAEDWIETGASKHLTASYAPDVRPARAWRNIPAAAYWGQSDFQGIEPHARLPRARAGRRLARGAPDLLRPEHAPAAGRPEPVGSRAVRDPRAAAHGHLLGTRRRGRPAGRLLGEHVRGTRRGPGRHRDGDQGPRTALADHSGA
jgi:hypothetical protein